MISVVIPAFNEEKYIAKCLDSLVRQRTNRKFEIIVVDNNSTDGTFQVIQKYKNKCDLRIVPEKKKGRGTARFTGFKQAKGEIILGTEADAWVPPTWIDDLSGIFKEKDIAAVTGPCKYYGCSLFVKFFMDRFQPLGMILHRVIYGYFWLSGFNFAIRKSAYIKSGGFNPGLNTYDDVELGRKVKAIGKVKFVRNLPVIVSGRRFKNGLLRGLYSYLKPFVGFSILNKKSIYLDDPR